MAEDPTYGLRAHEGEIGKFFVEGDTDQAESEEFAVKNPSGGRLLPGGKDAQEVMSGSRRAFGLMSCKRLKRYQECPFGWGPGRRRFGPRHVPEFIEQLNGS